MSSLLSDLLDAWAAQEAFDAGKHPRDFRGRWEKKAGALAKAHPSVTLDVSAREEGLVLSRIAVGAAARGKGAASKAFADLLAFADEHGKAVALTPEPIGKGGMTKAQLTKWYRAHGFVPNKGRAKDYAFRESFIRPAK